MKLIVLHDDAGKILAAVRPTEHYAGPIPVAHEGTRVVYVDIPQEHAALDLSALCMKLRVDMQYKLVERKPDCDSI